MTAYTVSEGTRQGAIEVAFAARPEAAEIAALKGLKFRWNPKKSVWHGFNTAEALNAALGGSAVPAAPAAPAEPEEIAKATPIKFYWNGIKVNGSNELIKCGFSVQSDGNVYIYCKDYKHGLPNDLFRVINETDLYTDYFDDDHTHVTPDHPLYKYAYYVARKSDNRYNLRRLKWMEKYAGRYDYTAEIESTKAKIAEFEAMTDPGQPTNADLLKIDAENQRTENERIQREHEEELKEREKYLNLRCNGRRTIEKYAEQFPVVEGGAICVIEWSEHPSFNAYAELYQPENMKNFDCNLVLSIAAADKILAELDAEMPYHEGYYKTSFIVNVPNEADPDDPYSYEGRYDIGDHEKGLIDHIRSFGEWYRTHDDYGHEKAEPEETNDTIQFADMLAAIVA